MLVSPLPKGICRITLYFSGCFHYFVRTLISFNTCTMYPTKPLHQFKISVILISSDKFQRNKVSVRCRLNVRRLLCMKGRMFSIFQPLVLLTFPDMTKIRPFLLACIGFCPSSLCPLFIKTQRRRKQSFSGNVACLLHRKMPLCWPRV